jgi:hypothetical protein
MSNPGETVALRGVYKQRVCYTQSARVIKDTPKETVLLVKPGAECAAPAGYIHKRHGDGTSWNRWHETLIIPCTWKHIRGTQIAF